MNLAECLEVNVNRSVNVCRGESGCVCECAVCVCLLDVAAEALVSPEEAH